MGFVSVPSGMDFLPSKSLPQGLTLLEEFVTTEEEETLLNCVDWTNCSEDMGKYSRVQSLDSPTTVVKSTFPLIFLHIFLTRNSRVFQSSNPLIKIVPLNFGTSTLFLCYPS